MKQRIQHLLDSVNDEMLEYNSGQQNEVGTHLSYGTMVMKYLSECIEKTAPAEFFKTDNEINVKSLKVIKDLTTDIAERIQKGKYK